MTALEACLQHSTGSHHSPPTGSKHKWPISSKSHSVRRKAEQVRQKLLDMQKEYLIELGDAVIAVKQPNGRVKLNQSFNPTASGAVSGGFWGALIGMIFLMPLAGAAIGAASGASAARWPMSASTTGS